MVSADGLLRCGNDMRPFMNAGTGSPFDGVDIIDWGIVSFTHYGREERSDSNVAEMLSHQLRELWELWYGHQLQFDANLILNEHSTLIDIRSPEPERGDMKWYKENLVRQLSEAILRNQLRALIVILPS
eukprot:CAMPEP_0202723446 /NCGR_PEP_ID=MMETSP1385-20130828/165778_1 /ASSEMBLY_ACC=CAM_ASM_000861 /TAXON_ID=933848 /ORGANISM="Elphidium margaritaceum" /LENGTH=128 /DNA_ID=CAMNT_0049388601 /DNA_START=31 /DNA_END=414 /DNA_ORIENTATION=+